jgi:transposase
MHITRAKKDFIRRRYIAGQLNVMQMAQVLSLQRATIRFYLNEFKVIKYLYPEKLGDFSFFIDKEKVTKETPWHKNLVRVLPELVASEAGPVLLASTLYRKYALIFPGEYSSVRFYYLFKRWFAEHKEALCAKKLKAKFTTEELETLAKWRKSYDRRRWQVAVALMTVYTYHSLCELADRVECTRHTLRRWLRIYDKLGLAGLDRDGDERPMTKEKAAEIEVKMDNLVHLVRQSPKNYGIDRASWFIADLGVVYEKEYGQYMSMSTVSLYLKRRGVRFKRSREVIVSTDPDFLPKYRVIQDTLSNLGAKEKFFSIDEYGPCSVRPKGGKLRALPGEQPTYLQVDKGKGYIICTAALELSTNQITWFYSKKKNTEEMIKLIQTLSEQYQDQDKLYMSWDAASWHASKQLLDYLEEIKAQKPEIVLAPLPARAPHMNVIESVFSGMSKSVIRNSDYASVNQCKAAIDRYFVKRNTYFLENPKKAGLKIWGKEKVKAVFDKANICKNL